MMMISLIFNFTVLLNFLSQFTPDILINSTGLDSTVEWDSISLFLFGRRMFILSAEFHPWRNLNPNLGRDIFDKVKGNGFNTVSYPSPGVNSGTDDFTEGTYVVQGSSEVYRRG
jgi:hypothetical protein